jgi:hypothetical protein
MSELLPHGNNYKIIASAVLSNIVVSFKPGSLPTCLDIAPGCRHC